VSVGFAEELDTNTHFELGGWLSSLNGNLLLAESDPLLKTLHTFSASDITLMPEVGCEKGAEWVLRTIQDKFQVTPIFVEFREHESNAGGVMTSSYGDITYFAAKTYTASRGMTVNWLDHNNKVDGGSLEVSVLFTSTYLDECNWVYPFGNLKQLKEELDRYYDHTTLVPWARWVSQEPIEYVNSIPVPTEGQNIGYDDLLKHCNKVVTDWFETTKQLHHDPKVNAVGIRVARPHWEWVYN
jgi:hypothetical protein